MRLNEKDAASRTAESSRARGRRASRSDKSSKELATEKLRSFEAPGIADGEEIGVDQKCGYKARLFA